MPSEKELISRMIHMLKKIFENVFNSTDHQKIDSLVNFTATTEDEAPTCVKIKGKDIVVTAGKALHVQCKADVGILERKTRFKCLKKNYLKASAQ